MTPGVRLDRIDMKILIELQNNSRITNVNLADAVGLSPSPCLLRVKRLEQAGFISGYGATINLAKLGETITVFTEVTLADHTKEYFIRFETALRRVDEVVTRTDLSEHVWDESFDGLSNVIDVTVHRLRRKIDGDRTDRLLHTDKGVGYVLRSSRE